MKLSVIKWHTDNKAQTGETEPNTKHAVHVLLSVKHFYISPRKRTVHPFAVTLTQSKVTGALGQSVLTFGKRRNHHSHSHLDIFNVFNKPNMQVFGIWILTHDSSTVSRRLKPQLHRALSEGQVFRKPNLFRLLVNSKRWECTSKSNKTIPCSRSPLPAPCPLTRFNKCPRKED